MPTAVETFFLDTNVLLLCAWLNHLPWKDLTGQAPAKGEGEAHRHIRCLAIEGITRCFLRARISIPSLSEAPARAVPLHPGASPKCSRVRQRAHYHDQF